MVVYVVEYGVTKSNSYNTIDFKISQEGYVTLQDAQTFCISRGAIKITPYIFHKKLEKKYIGIYRIVDVRIE